MICKKCGKENLDSLNKCVYCNQKLHCEVKDVTLKPNNFRQNDNTIQVGDDLRQYSKKKVSFKTGIIILILSNLIAYFVSKIYSNVTYIPCDGGGIGCTFENAGSNFVSIAIIFPVILILSIIVLYNLLKK